MFGLGGPELLLIAVVALLVLGPEKLPEIMKKLAGIVRELRRAGDEVRQHIDPDGELYRATRYPLNLDLPARIHGNDDMPEKKPAAPENPEQAASPETASPAEDSEKKTEN